MLIEETMELVDSKFSIQFGMLSGFFTGVVDTRLAKLSSSKRHLSSGLGALEPKSGQNPSVLSLYHDRYYLTIYKRS